MVLYAKTVIEFKFVGNTRFLALVLRILKGFVPLVSHQISDSTKIFRFVSVQYK